MKRLLTYIFILLVSLAAPFQTVQDSWATEIKGNFSDLITKGPWIDSRAYPTLTLTQIDAIAFAAGKLLLIAQNHTLTANTVLTADVMVIPGGSFTEASTYSLTFSGSFSTFKDCYDQIFFGFTRLAISPWTFPVSFGKDTEILPEWFGTTADGTTDDRAAYQLASDALAASGKGSLKTQNGKSYKLGSDGLGSLYLYASNVIYEFGTSKFIGSVAQGDYLGNKTTKPENVIIRGGVYTPSEEVQALPPPPTNRYIAGTNGLSILIGKNVHIQNPTCLIGSGSRGISIQTSTTWGTTPWLNIENVIVDNPIIIGSKNPYTYPDTAAPSGLDVGSAPNSNMIQNVAVNNAIVKNVFRGLVATTGDVAQIMDNISFNNFILDNISDEGLIVVGVRGGRFSGRINGVGWHGARIVNAPACHFDLSIRGYSTLWTPTGQTGNPYGISTDDTGAGVFGSTIFGKTIIEGYDASNRWDTGIITSMANSIFQSVSLKNCTVGINSNIQETIWGDLLFHTVTTPILYPTNMLNVWGKTQDTTTGVPVTIQIQPGFLATNATIQSNVTGTADVYTVIFDTERFDHTSNYNTSTGIFTAPKTGRYFFWVTLYLQDVGAAHTLLIMNLVTSNLTYTLSFINAGAIQSGGYLILNGSAGNVDMDVDDTAYITLDVRNGTKVIDVLNSMTVFGGHLVQ